MLYRKQIGYSIIHDLPHWAAHSLKTQNRCDTDLQTLQCSCTISVGKHYAGLNFMSLLATVK